VQSTLIGAALGKRLRWAPLVDTWGRSALLYRSQAIENRSLRERPRCRRQTVRDDSKIRYDRWPTGICLAPRHDCSQLLAHCDARVRHCSAKNGVKVHVRGLPDQRPPRVQGGSPDRPYQPARIRHARAQISLADLATPRPATVEWDCIHRWAIV
jgi:hypothetical protein